MVIELDYNVSPVGCGETTHSLGLYLALLIGIQRPVTGCWFDTMIPRTANVIATSGSKSDYERINWPLNTLFLVHWQFTAISTYTPFIQHVIGATENVRSIHDIIDALEMSNVVRVHQRQIDWRLSGEGFSEYFGWMLKWSIALAVGFIVIYSKQWKWNRYFNWCRMRLPILTFWIEHTPQRVHGGNTFVAAQRFEFILFRCFRSLAVVQSCLGAFCLHLDFKFARVCELWGKWNEWIPFADSWSHESILFCDAKCKLITALRRSPWDDSTMLSMVSWLGSV